MRQGISFADAFTLKNEYLRECKSEPKYRCWICSYLQLSMIRGEIKFNEFALKYEILTVEIKIENLCINFREFKLLVIFIIIAECFTTRTGE